MSADVYQTVHIPFCQFRCFPAAADSRFHKNHINQLQRENADKKFFHCSGGMYHFSLIQKNFKIVFLHLGEIINFNFCTRSLLKGFGYVAADLEYRNAGDPVIGNLQFPSVRCLTSAINNCSYRCICADSGSLLKAICFQCCEGRNNRRYGMAK